MDRENYTLINEYRNNLEALGIRVKRIVLYGSHASGTATEHSDLDLLVVSDDLEDMDLWERLCLLGEARMGIKRPMEILGLTEEEYESDNVNTFIRDEVKAKGIVVIPGR